MYIKALQTGKIDMDTWNTLSETMDVGLVKIAESFGFAGRTAKDDLYSALQDGTITLDQFNDALLEVGTGTGIMAKLARENTLGIATSCENLKTAAVRGLVEIIDAFNKLSKEVTGKEIAQNIDSLKRVVFTSFRAMAKVIEATTPVVVLFANGVKMAIPVVQALTPAIIGLMTAYGAYVVITKASTAIQVASAALKAATTTTVGASTAMASLTIVQQASTKAVQADMLIRALQNKQIGVVTIAIGLLTGKVSLATVAQMAMTVATNALGAALRFMMGPIGWVITAIGLLTTGVVALVKWFKRTSKEADRLNKETEELADENAQLADSVESSSKSYENSKDSIETTAKANQELIKQIEELSQKENKSAADKKLLQSYVDDLNESIEDLNLVYGEETDALSMSSEQLMKRVELMQEEEKMLASQERLTETIEEQIEIGKQLDEVNELREEWNQKLEDGEIKTREHTKAMVDLDNQQEELMETMKEATDARVEADRQLEESAERVAEMTEESIGRQGIMYEELSETQKQAIDGMKDSWEDYKDHATEMFDVLSDESEFTIEEMTKNLEENRRIMGEWADGIAELAERGVDQGLLDKLREAGPESAGHVNALVNASDDELEKLSETFAKGGETATDALSSALDIDKTEIIDKLGHLIVDTEKSLREQVKDADFESIGVDVVHGMAGGIDEKAYEAERAAKEIAEDVVDSTQETLGIASPSKVYREFGGDITDGLSLGVSRGTRKVINSAIKLLRSTISKFDGIYNRFNTIGQNAINGLNAGLNAGRGRVDRKSVV